MGGTFRDVVDAKPEVSFNLPLRWMEGGRGRANFPRDGRRNAERRTEGGEQAWIAFKTMRPPL